MAKQLLTDAVERLEQMCGPYGAETWDLSPNDREAIAMVLEDRTRLLDGTPPSAPQYRVVAIEWGEATTIIEVEGLVSPVAAGDRIIYLSAGKEPGK